MQRHFANSVVLLSPFGPTDGGQLREFNMVELYGEELDRIDELVDAPRSQLIVARRGAGRTCFAKQLHTRLRDSPSVATCESIQAGRPQVIELEKVGEQRSAAIRGELWKLIWHAALLRSLTSNLLNGDGLRLLDDADGALLRLTWAELLGSCGQSMMPLDVFSQIKAILDDEERGATSLEAYLRHSDWAQFEAQLAATLDGERTACLVIDLDDDVTFASLASWMSCQQGLLRAIAELNAGPLGNSVMVLATSREAHYTWLPGTEKTLKLRENVWLLDLDETDTADYLDRMLIAISRWADASMWHGALRALMDDDPIDNVVRDCVERVRSYVIRHTRSLPRDIVVAGNELAHRRRNQPFDYEDVRRAVRGCARAFGEEQVAACAQALMANMSAEDTTAEYLQSCFATPGGYENPTLASRLHRVISDIGVDRFSRERLEQVRVRTTGEFPHDVADALWRGGLLGYTQSDLPRGHVVFYALRVSSSELPNSREYAFHPCLIDSAGLDPVGSSHPPTTPIAEKS